MSSYIRDIIRTNVRVTDDVDGITDDEVQFNRVKFKKEEMKQEI